MPRLAPGQAVKKSVNFKISDELRKRLEEAAAANGRNLSREIEQRLTDSFIEPGRDPSDSLATVHLVEIIRTAIAKAEMRMVDPETRRFERQPWENSPLAISFVQRALTEVVRLYIGEIRRHHPAGAFEHPDLGILERADGSELEGYDHGLFLAAAAMVDNGFLPREIRERLTSEQLKSTEFARRIPDRSGKNNGDNKQD